MTDAQLTGGGVDLTRPPAEKMGLSGPPPHSGLTLLVLHARAAHRELDRCLDLIEDEVTPFGEDVRSVRRDIDDAMELMSDAARAHRDYERERRECRTHALHNPEVPHD